MPATARAAADGRRSAVVGAAVVRYTAGPTVPSRPTRRAATQPAGAAVRAAAMLALAAATAGCGGVKATSWTCTPACPAGLSCTEGGCLPDRAADLAVAAAADLAVTPCDPGCPAPTPYCGPGDFCVACLVDAHCPLGQACARLGTASLCAHGCSDDTRCPTGQKCCGAACVDPLTDAANCGACGRACTPSGAAGVCLAGACQPGACDPGQADCNHDGSDGCEARLATDPDNCGQCGTSCSGALPHATAACATSCYIAACDFGWADCNGDAPDGCEQGVLSDAKNCGGCGVACPPAPHATLACQNANCALAACSPGYADCNGDPLDGCEAVTASDKQNCGQCGSVCGQGLVCRSGACTCVACNFPNARSSCVNGVCAMGACVPGFGDCNHNPVDGCEVDLSADAASCGACGAACPINLPVCQMGACSACLSSLEGIGLADFTIAFSIQTAANATSTVIGQRGLCAHDKMWDVRIIGGPLQMEFDDLVNYTEVVTKARVNDNNVHAVVVKRVAGTLTVTIDGVLDSTAPAAESFAALTPLFVAAGDPCEKKDGTLPLVGAVTDVCLGSP